MIDIGVSIILGTKDANSKLHNKLVFFNTNCCVIIESLN